MFFCFYFVMVYRTELKEGVAFVLFFSVFFTESLCVFSSVYVVLSVVFYPLGFVICVLFFSFLVQSIRTSGMSITLIKQNVSRYYAPRPTHPLTIVYKTSSVFPFHVSDFLFWSPSLILLL